MTIKKTIPHRDDDAERPICPDCGEPLSDQDIFHSRMQAMADVLEDAAPFDITVMLAILAGEHMGAYKTAKARSQSRGDFLDILDEIIKKAAAMWAQRKREDAAVRRAGSHPILMPDVPNTLN